MSQHVADNDLYIMRPVNENRAAQLDLIEIDKGLLEIFGGDIKYALTPREEHIMRMRFGLVDGIKHTLKEIGLCFQIGPERIRQIEAKALYKLRRLCKVDKYRNP